MCLQWNIKRSDFYNPGRLPLDEIKPYSVDTQMLKKYEQVPDNIKYGEEGSYTLQYGEIKVLIGSAQNLNEKIVRLSHVLPKLEGQKGTLHLESWTENTTDITFEKAG